MQRLAYDENICVVILSSMLRMGGRQEITTAAAVQDRR
jgi:hypothetical protein